MSGRVEKVASVLKHHISQLILREISDKRIGFISITEVKVNPDMKHALVYYSPFGKNVDLEKVQKGLAAATKYIQRELFKKLEMKNIPQIHFRYDDTIEKGSYLVEKINALHVKDPSEPEQ